MVSRLKLFKALTIQERILLYKENDHLKKETDELILQEEDDNYFFYFKGNTAAQSKYVDTFIDDNFISETELKKIMSGGFLNLLEKQALISFPDWLTRLEKLYTGYAPDGNYFSSIFIDDVKLAGFFNPFEPIIRYGRQKLKDHIHATTKGFKTFHFDYQEMERQLINNIAYTLFDSIDRTLVLELNISKFEGTLQGEDPAKRFAYFIEQISTYPKLAYFIEDYPILFRQALDFIERWVTVSSNLVLRLNKDLYEIKAFFNIEDEKGIKKLHINAGDRHKGGETVVIITFASNEKIVYKPHSLRTDVHFQELLQWVNRQGLNLPLKTLKLIQKGDYGWVEFIENISCDNEDEIKRFYQRIGALLAILYCINATDFHYENVIAHGEYPMLIDLESLFHGPSAFGYDDVDVAINRRIEESVLSIQLLPFKLYVKDGMVDISGITNMEGKESPTPVASWQAIATDDMKVERIKTFFSGGKNAPSLKNANEIKMLDYSNVIEDAFRTCYAIFFDQKEFLLSSTSPLYKFKDDEIRILLRNTSNYVQMIRSCFHPDHLQNHLEREKLFSLLWDIADEKNNYHSIIPLEKDSMNQMDVPFFSTKPSSRDLLCNGNIIPDFYEKTGIEYAMGKIERLSADDCEQQCWFIRASLSSSTANHLSIEDLNQPRYKFIPSEQEATKVEMVKTAALLADKMLKTCIREGGYANWPSMILVDGKNYDVKPLMIDLYSGLPGVCIFFAALYSETKEEKYLTLLNECLNNIRRLTDRYMAVDFAERIGAFDGWAGIVYAFYFIDALVEMPDLKKYADTLLSYLLTKINALESYDVLDGIAGVAIVLKNIYETTPTPELLTALSYLGDKLAGAAIAMEIGAGWQNNKDSVPLTGFGHGAAGISFALFEINKICPKSIYLEKAIAGIEFESSKLIEQAGNWMDLRVFREGGIESQTKHEMMAWCHGAVGIGISRVNILKQCASDLVHKDLKIALRSTLERGFGQNHSLCHGDFGNLELLLQCAEFYEDQGLRKLMNQICKPLIDYLQTNACIGGVALGVENPSFMIGTAGVAYQLLRLSNPEKYPSVLTLSLPGKRKSNEMRQTELKGEKILSL